MPDNPFTDKTSHPSGTELAEVLGRSKKYWDDLHVALKEAFGEAKPEWKFYSPKYGWTLRLYHKKRTIIWLAPRAKRFAAAFTLGEKAFAAALKSKLPAELKAQIKAAKKYAEGRPASVEVKTKQDFDTVLALAHIKMAN